MPLPKNSLFKAWIKRVLQENSMKKELLLILPALLISMMGCDNQNHPSNSNSGSEQTTIDYAPIDQEIKGCYNYFKYATNLKEGSPGYGLTLDRWTNKSMSSIAATGFLLASYPVFVEQGLMSKDEANQITSKTLDTVLRIQADTTASYGGCLSHFVSIENGTRYSTDIEISTIDTAILVSGAICAGEYFQGEVKEKANTLWGNVDYTKFVTKKNSKSYISMGVRDLDNPEQLSPWDFYAEQLMIYIIGAGNPVLEHRITSLYYKNITKSVGAYGEYSYIYSWFGSLFTYQYSQAFFNFKNYNDDKGRNYYENSVNASKAAYQYCVDNKDKYRTFSEQSWGLTACDTPTGYSGLLGTPPRGYSDTSSTYLAIESTVAPTAALGSMPFTPEESMRALKYYQSIEVLNDEDFGLRDAFNLDFVGGEWYCADFIGIDKGIEVLQLYNYKNTDFVCNLAMNNPNVILGFTNNGFSEVNNGI